MTWRTDITNQVKAIQAQGNTNRDDLAALTDEVAVVRTIAEKVEGVRLAVAALDARVKALEDWRTSLETPSDLPIIGVATWTLADLRELESLIGPVKAHRVFDRYGEWDATRTASGGIADDIVNGRWSIASWVGYPSDADLETLRATTPPGHRLSITCRHEVDRDKDTPAGHHEQMTRISDIVHSWDRPEITTRVTYTGYGGEAGSGQRVRRWLDTGIADVVDHVSIDPYNTYGYNGQTKWTHPIELLVPWTVLGDEYGFRERLCIDEYSCPEHPAGPDWKVADLAQMVAIADAERMAWFTYFDVQQGEISDGPDHRVKSSPEHLAAFGGYAART